METQGARTLGAVPLAGGRVRFRVWAPSSKTVDVELQTDHGARHLPLEQRPGGYFEGEHSASVGARYRYRLDGRDSLPDPASRFQPEGPHGPSELVDPNAFKWTDEKFTGITDVKGQVLYELHVGLYTPEGTFAALTEQLPSLKDLGITTLELMPVNGFPGRFNWGYDGVNLFAPNKSYGRPDDLRRLVDRAHALGLSVILDVVYNHLGPDGNYLGRFSRQYFSDKYPREWGDPLNFDGEGSPAVRDFVTQNAQLWIREYHLDGLRIDATQSLYDSSKRHICAELTQAARDAAPRKKLLLVAESEPQAVEAIRSSSEGGWGMDMVWVDDFHHSARAAVTGKREAYLRDYCGTAQELLSCALRNSLYQGQYYAWQKKRRGGVLLREPAPKIVFYLENHDQVANQLPSRHLHQLAGEARTRAVTTFLLLLPQTPLLFMGQEFHSTAPFFYFTDHPEELQRLVKRGRSEFLMQFPSAKCALEREGLALPFGEEAFRRSKLDLSERDRHRAAWNFHRDLLKLRREDPVFSAQESGQLAGAVLSQEALVLRWLTATGDDRAVILNLGAELAFDPCPEPLLSPGPAKRWALLLSSCDSRYGGIGACFPDGTSKPHIAGHSAVALKAVSSEEENPR